MIAPGACGVKPAVVGDASPVVGGPVVGGPEVGGLAPVRSMLDCPAR